MLGHSSIGSSSLGSWGRHIIIAIIGDVHAESATHDLLAHLKPTLAKVAAESTVYDSNFVLIGNMETVQADAATYDLQPHLKPLLAKVTAQAAVYASDLIIPLPGVPVLNITKDGTTVTVEVRNIGDQKVQLYRANEYRKNFTKLTKISSVYYEDTGLAAGTNYKYKASFVFDAATKDGNPYFAESRRSGAKYTG